MPFISEILNISEGGKIDIGNTERASGVKVIKRKKTA
jgi:hypothetical protein